LVSEVKLPVNMFELNKVYKVDHRLQLSDKVLARACFLLFCTVNCFLYVASIAIFASRNLVELYTVHTDY